MTPGQNRRAAHIARISMYISIGMLGGSMVLWAVATVLGWVKSTVFVSHVSMLALMFGAFTAVTASLSAKWAQAAEDPAQP